MVRVFLGKCSKWNLDFKNWLKALCLGVSEPTKRLAVQSTAYATANTENEDLQYGISRFWKKCFRETVFSTLDGAGNYWKK